MGANCHLPFCSQSTLCIDKMIEDKFCIVGQGGGVTTAYQAGVVLGLQEKYGFEKLGRVVASSGTAIVYSYLLSGQLEVFGPFWVELLKSRDFISFLRHPTGRGILNIDFLIDEMAKRKYPLDTKRLMKNPVQLEVSVTNAETGEAKFYPKESDLDYFELLRATCAVPYFYGKHVLLDNEYYCDGEIGSLIGLEAIANYKNILIVLTRPPEQLPKLLLVRKLLQWLLIRHETPALQSAIWEVQNRFNELPDILHKLRSERHVVVIAPSMALSMNRIDNRLGALKKVMEQGKMDALASNNVKTFMDNLVV